MERVEPNYNLSRWIESNPYPVAPVTFYGVMKQYRENIGPSTFGEICNNIANEIFPDQDRVTEYDIGKILSRFLINETFDDDHIPLMCRVLVKATADLIEVPVDGMVIYYPYTTRSYDDFDWLHSYFGTNLISVDEMRDSNGVLKQYRVVLRYNNEERQVVVQ